MAPGAVVEPMVGEAEEKACIAASGGMAVRERCKLILTLAYGREKVFDELSEECGLSPERETAYEIPRFHAWLPDLKTFVVSKSGWEWSHVLLVSSETGLSQTVGSGMYLSPDGSTLLELNNLDGLGSGDYPLGVWTFDGFQMRRVLRHNGAKDDYYWVFERWVGPNEAIASVHRNARGPDIPRTDGLPPSPNYYQQAFTARIFRDKAGTWKFQVSKTPRPG